MFIVYFDSQLYIDLTLKSLKVLVACRNLTCPNCQKAENFIIPFHFETALLYIRTYIHLHTYKYIVLCSGQQKHIWQHLNHFDTNFGMFTYKL